LKLSLLATATFAAFALAAPSPNDAAFDSLAARSDSCNKYYKEYKSCKKYEDKYKKHYNYCKKDEYKDTKECYDCKKYEDKYKNEYEKCRKKSGKCYSEKKKYNEYKNKCYEYKGEYDEKKGECSEKYGNYEDKKKECDGYYDEYTNCKKLSMQLGTTRMHYEEGSKTGCMTASVCFRLDLALINQQTAVSTSCLCGGVCCDWRTE
jgi:hypothetical protein